MKLTSTKEEKWSNFLTPYRHKMGLNVKTFRKVKSISQMQGGLCCYMNHREDGSEAPRLQFWLVSMR